MQTGNTDFHKPYHACFQHDRAYGKSKDLRKRTQSDKVLKDEAFKLLVIQNTMVLKED